MCFVLFQYEWMFDRKTFSQDTHCALAEGLYNRLLEIELFYDLNSLIIFFIYLLLTLFLFIFVLTSAGRKLKCGQSRVLFGLEDAEYTSVAIANLGKQDVDFDEEELVYQGMENVRAAVASEDFLILTIFYYLPQWSPP